MGSEIVHSLYVTGPRSLVFLTSSLGHDTFKDNRLYIYLALLKLCGTFRFMYKVLVSALYCFIADWHTESGQSFDVSYPSLFHMCE